MASFLSYVLPNIIYYNLINNAKKPQIPQISISHHPITPFNYKKYGWKRDLPDIRDHKFEMNYLSIVEKPQKHVDLRKLCPSVYNQGELGSCTANAIACAIQFDELKQTNKKENEEVKQTNDNKDNIDIPSRLFIYYNERDMEGNINTDSGASLRDGIKSINKIGYCNETQWPYEIEHFREKPNEECYEYAKSHKSLSYKRVQQDETHLKSVLNMGFPIVFGISVYESFESEETAKTGIVPIPSKEERMLGGHAIVLVGYNDEKRWFVFRNSWGEGWGDKGYGYLPYEYVCDENLASDFWVVNKVC